MAIKNLVKIIKEIQSTQQLHDYAIIRVTGNDATTFLQGQITCDVKQLDDTPSLPGAFCDPKGRMIATFWVWRDGDAFFLILPKNNRDNFITKIAKFAAFSNVEITAIDEQQVFGVIGPCGDYAVKLPGDIERYFLIADTLKTNEDNTLWHAANIATGLCDIDISTSGLFTPQMINLEKFEGVSFTKGCFVGQEIIARTQHLGKLKRHLQTLTADEPLTINAGDKITNEKNENIGTVVEFYVNDATYILAVVEDRALNNSMHLNGANLQPMG